MNKMNRSASTVGVSLTLFAMNSVIASMPTKNEDEAAIRTILQHVWERIDGRWQIIHEHNSLALDPEPAKNLLYAIQR